MSFWNCKRYIHQTAFIVELDLYNVKIFLLYEIFRFVEQCDYQQNIEIRAPKLDCKPC